jgi:mRNA interferase HigB
MRVVSNKALLAFADEHPDARVPLQGWRRAIQSGAFASFSDLRSTFGSVDKVGRFFVFDIGGNKFRLVAAIHFDRQTLYIRHVLTHREYDDWTP